MGKKWTTEIVGIEIEGMEVKKKKKGRRREEERDGEREEGRKG